MSSVIRGSDSFDSAKRLAKGVLTNRAGQRAFATPYTNNTGAPLLLWVNVRGSSLGQSEVFFYKQGSLIGQYPTNFSNGAAWIPVYQTIFAVVLPGQTYQVSNGNGSIPNSIVSWWEEPAP